MTRDPRRALVAAGPRPGVEAVPSHGAEDGKGGPRGGTPAVVPYLADVLDPRWAADPLRGGRVVTAAEVFDGDPDEVDEEGTT